jgi:large subunit ribosomal protein L6
MSRIGNTPVVLPDKVEVTLGADQISVKGPLGTLSRRLNPQVKIEKVENRVEFKANDNSHQADALSGTMRALVANMVTGVTKGFEKKLTLVGVGYRAQAQGSEAIELALGFSHPVRVQAPAGVTFEVPQPTRIVVRGFDKQLVGQVAADIRKIRKPEPYKGKGIRYVDERVLRKAGKSAK